MAKERAKFSLKRLMMLKSNPALANYLKVMDDAHGRSDIPLTGALAAVVLLVCDTLS